jgi:hypothetical protein
MGQSTQLYALENICFCTDFAVKLKETNEQLENLRYQLELNPSKVTNVIENAVVNDTGSSESGYVKHGTESLENGEINEAVKQEQVTLLESADPHSTLLVSSAKENEVLKVRLTASEERIKSLVDEIDNLKLSSTDSERQFERLRGERDLHVTAQFIYAQCVIQ